MRNISRTSDEKKRSPRRINILKNNIIFLMYEQTREKGNICTETYFAYNLYENFFPDKFVSSFR